MQTDICRACGKPIAAVNIDKMRGIVGLTYGWVHISRYGRIRNWVRHAPVPSDDAPASS